MDGWNVDPRVVHHLLDEHLHQQPSSSWPAGVFRAIRRHRVPFGSTSAIRQPYARPNAAADRQSLEKDVQLESDPVIRCAPLRRSLRRTSVSNSPGICLGNSRLRVQLSRSQKKVQATTHARTKRTRRCIRHHDRRLAGDRRGRGHPVKIRHKHCHPSPSAVPPFASGPSFYLPPFVSWIKDRQILMRSMRNRHTDSHAKCDGCQVVDFHSIRHPLEPLNVALFTARGSH